MANLKELSKQIRYLHTKNEKADLNHKIDLCFKSMELYCNITPKRHTQSDEKECCYAAVILSGIIQKGLSKKVLDFLENNIIPLRGEQLLRTNLMRMESY